MYAKKQRTPNDREAAQLWNNIRGRDMYRAEILRRTRPQPVFKEIIPTNWPGLQKKTIILFLLGDLA